MAQVQKDMLDLFSQYYGKIMVNNARKIYKCFFNRKKYIKD